MPSSMFAVSRCCAPSAAISQKIRLYLMEVRPSARPAAIHAHMPAIEIAFGETFREVSHAVAACAHFRFRVAMGRRSIAFAVVSFMADAIHKGLMSDAQMTTRGERHAFVATRMRSPLEHRAF